LRKSHSTPLFNVRAENNVVHQDSKASFHLLISKGKKILFRSEKIQDIKKVDIIVNNEGVISNNKDIDKSINYSENYRIELNENINKYYPLLKKKYLSLISQKHHLSLINKDTKIKESSLLNKNFFKIYLINAD